MAYMTIVDGKVLTVDAESGVEHDLFNGFNGYTAFSELKLEAHELGLKLDQAVDFYGEFNHIVSVAVGIDLLPAGHISKGEVEILKPQHTVMAINPTENDDKLKANIEQVFDKAKQIVIDALVERGIEDAESKITITDGIMMNHFD